MEPSAANQIKSAIGPQLYSLSEYHLNSSDANTKNATYENACTFPIPQVIAPEYQAINITLKSCTIPVSWYMINIYNNTLKFFNNGTTYTSTLTVGNYTVYTFGALVTDAILSASGITIAFGYSTVTGKATFTRASNPSNQSWGFTTASTCLREIGFYNATTTAVLRTTGTVLTSPNVVDLTSVNTVLVNTNLNGPNYDTSSKAVGGIIARIPVSVQFAGVLDPAPNFPTTAITDRDIRFFTITLLDQNSNLITATTPWQMTLLVSFSWDLNHSYFQPNKSLLAPSSAKMAAPLIAGREEASPAIKKTSSGPVDRGDLKSLLEGLKLTQKRKRSGHPDSAADDQTPSSELEPSEEENVAMTALNNHIAERMDVTGRDTLEPQTYGANAYPPAPDAMLAEFHHKADRLAHLSRDPLGSTNNQKRILSVLSVGPNTVHTNNAGPGVQ